MKTTHLVAVMGLIVGSGLASHVARAQQPGITRTDLQQHDLSVSGREAIQVLVEFAPGVVAPRHSHPGEELVYVVEGVLEYQLDGRPPATLKAGEVLFILIYGTLEKAWGAAGDVSGTFVDRPTRAWRPMPLLAPLGAQ